MKENLWYLWYIFLGVFIRPLYYYVKINWEAREWVNKKMKEKFPNKICGFRECPSPVHKNGYCIDHQDMVIYYGKRKGVTKNGK